jgi:4'-phosphopantetheinyl transferase
VPYSTFGFQPLELELASDEIHVWRASLDQPVSQFNTLGQTLSVDERAKAERFHFERDRKHFVVGRGILRTILASYLKVKAVKVQFRYGKNGKPALANTFGKGTIFFNFSDSEGLALYAFSRDGEVGVDVENIRYIPEMDQIVERFFSPGENVVYQSLPKSMRTKAFFNGWTRKEAFMKATGEGLSLGLDRFEVSLAPGEPAALLMVNGDAQEASHWSLWAVDPGPDFVAAVAIERRGSWVNCLQWK